MYLHTYNIHIYIYWPMIRELSLFLAWNGRTYILYKFPFSGNPGWCWLNHEGWDLTAPQAFKPKQMHTYGITVRVAPTFHRFYFDLFSVLKAASHCRQVWRWEKKDVPYSVIWHGLLDSFTYSSILVARRCPPKCGQPQVLYRWWRHHMRCDVGMILGRYIGDIWNQLSSLSNKNRENMGILWEPTS